MKTFYFDTETYPIRPGLMAPKLVCLQHAYDEDEPRVVLAKDSVGIFYEAFTNPNVLCEAHNEPFDLAVAAAHAEDLVQPIFRMLAEGRGRDTQIRETLKAIKEGTLDFRRKKKGEFALGTLCERYCGIQLDKGEESYRLRYALLDGIDPKDWPEAARKYALEDITGLRAVSKAIPYRSPDEWMQVAAAFVLHLASCWGMMANPKALPWVEVSLLTKKEEAEQLLEKAGFLRDGSVNQAAVKKAVEEACEKLGKPVPKTNPSKKFPQGQTKMDAETIESIAEAHPELTNLVKLGECTKTLSTYIAPLKNATIHPMNCHFNVLVNTGRTSSGGSSVDIYNPWWPEGTKPIKEVSGTNGQNWPREEGVRDCIIPRKGFYWLSVDYNSIELRTLAQAVLWVVGYSNLANMYKDDPNFDPYTRLAGKILGISYKEAMTRKKAGDKQIKKFRQLCKAAELGWPGGMGLKRFPEYAQKTYGVEISPQESVKLREAWFETYPEMEKFFSYISWLSNSKRPLKQLVSKRIRGDVGYCDAANGHFQSLAADGGKLALFAVSMACYAEPASPLFGTRPVAFVHDEIVAETPIEKAHEAAFEMVQLMQSEMQKVVPDVPILASPALSTRWLKAAEERYSKEGRLIPWDL